MREGGREEREGEREGGRGRVGGRGGGRGGDVMVESKMLMLVSSRLKVKVRKYNVWQYIPADK